MKLVAVGDLMLGDHPVCFGHGVRSTIETNGFDYIFKDVAKYFSGNDIVFGNLESVLSDHGYDPDNLISAELRGSGKFSSGLAAIGFNVLNIANNHILQHGADAFFETIQNIKNAGITPLGLRCKNNNLSEVVVIKDEDGSSVALVGYSLRSEKYYNSTPLYSLCDEHQILRQVDELIARFEGPVVVSLHWGDEYLHAPSASQVKFARKIIDKGVSLILGHHPHVLQGIEEYKSGLIVYSLGNFVFDKWQRSSRESIIFNCEILNNGIVDYSFVPVYINSTFQPIVAKDKKLFCINKKLNNYKNIILTGNLDDDKNYEKKAKKVYLIFRIQSYLYFILNINRYKKSILKQSILRFFKRRFNS